MLPSRLISLATTVSFGVALARRPAALSRSWTGPRAVLTNGRISPLITGVVFSASRFVEELTSSRLRANGRRSPRAGPSWSANCEMWVSAVVDCCSVPGSRRIARWTLGSCSAIAPIDVFEASTRSVRLCSLRPTSRVSRLKLVISRRRLSLRSATFELILSMSRVSGPSEPSRPAEVLVAPVERLPAADEQQPQVGAGVVVERAEDLVEVDVGRRVGELDRAALLDLARLLGAGVHLEEHVLEPGLRAAAGSSRPGRPAGSRGRRRR